LETKTLFKFAHKYSFVVGPGHRFKEKVSCFCA
jgi:hypothetical protein